MAVDGDAAGGLPARDERTQRYDVEAIRKDFPILERTGARRTCRWSTWTAPTPRRSRGRCWTRWPSTTSGTTPTSTAPSTCSARRRRRRTRAPGTRSPRLHRRAGPRGGRLHQERHRGAQPGGQRARLAVAAPGRRRRRDRRHRDGAPLQHRAVAAAGRADRRHAALVRHHRRRPAGPVPARRAGHRADEGRLAGPTCPTRSARSTRSPRSPGGRTRSARWWWSTPAQAVPQLPVDVTGARRRLRRLHRAQDVRPDRDRRAVGTARAARRAAAVPRRRRDDRDRPDERLDVRAAAVQVRGRHAADRARRSGSARRSTT